MKMKLFVCPIDFYSNPYVLVVVAPTKDDALDMLAYHKSRGFDQLKLNTDGVHEVDLTKTGIYLFESTGDRSLR